ncbi:MAG: glutamate 5-kinase [Actinomycetota bacterium]
MKNTDSKHGRRAKPGLIVVKLGTTSITGPNGSLDGLRVRKVTDQIARLKAKGSSVVIVTSGAIAAGVQALSLKKRPSDMPTLQAAAAVGQSRLMDLYSELLSTQGITAGQVLLTQDDIVQRRHYLNARHTLDRLLELGCVPVVNENDTVAVEEIRYGDNDRLAALVANIVRADLLALLSDVDGVFSSDPRTKRAPADGPVTLLETVHEVTPAMKRASKGSSGLGSGGMAYKLEAARMAAFSGVAVVIASAARPGVLEDIYEGKAVGTYFPPNRSPVQAKKLWIAWAPSARGRILVDEGAAHALTKGGKSLLAAGIRKVEGNFRAGDAVEVIGSDRSLVAKGLVGFDSDILASIAGTKGAREVIHRDQLVLM